ncbi:MAG TPA: FTR1 family protein [Chthoniobacterales bacterium]|jgi:high-affinity iron transporter|nr:FTR1 family protein [Chthoniobacterales bacterium]
MPSTRRHARAWVQLGIWAAALCLVAVIIWQAVAVHGAPDPLNPRATATVAILDIAVLVFREGLECILVLAAITASMTGPKRALRRPVALGAGGALIATLVTWWIAVQIMSQLSENVRALDLQAATGLLAVVVLLVIMNWFFHKIYWGGWIRAHNRRRKALLANGAAAEISRTHLRWGLILLGFTSLYREGFEVVLFLQSYRLRLGSGVVLQGALVGTTLAGLVALLTFFVQQRLPYRKMLVTTGVLLGVVLLVMVGEQAQEMQLAHWIPATPVPWLTGVVSPWMNLWFSIFPTYETLVAQLFAAVLVIGSYYVARHFGSRQPRVAEPVKEVRVGASAAVAEQIV